LSDKDIIWAISTGERLRNSVIKLADSEIKFGCVNAIGGAGDSKSKVLAGDKTINIV
jgi:hypothetical protein